MTMAAINPMPNYNSNHRLLRLKDAEKVNIIKTNNMFFTNGLIL